MAGRSCCCLSACCGHQNWQTRPRCSVGDDLADKYSTIQIWYTDILEGTCRVADQGDPAHHEISHMGDYPSFDYSKADVRKAGKIIARDVPWTNDSEPLIREAKAEGK